MYLIGFLFCCLSFPAILTLDSVNDQILSFITPLPSNSTESSKANNGTQRLRYPGTSFSNNSSSQAYHLVGTESKNGEGRYNEAIKASLGLMRNLLVDAQVSCINKTNQLKKQ